MKIVIVGVTGFRNRGVEALVQPIVYFLQQTSSAIHIEIATYSPEYDSLRTSNKRVSFVQDHYVASGRWAQPPAQNNSTAAKVFRRLKRIAGRFGVGDRASTCPIMPFESADLLIITGGDLFGGDYGIDSFRHYVEPLEWAKSRGIPSVLLAHSIGRFKTDEQIRLWAYAESLATHITLREQLSYDYLVNELGRDPARYVVTADVAFLLEPDHSYLPQLAELFTKPVVAVTISANIANWTSASDQEHENAWLEVLKQILDVWGANIVMIPHVQEIWGDDRNIATRILRELNFDPRVRMISDGLSAAEYKGIISKCDLVIAERMHASIAGLSTGVPTVSIGYSIKARGITSLVLEGSDIDSESLAIPLNDFVKLEYSLVKLSEVWRARDAMRSVIQNSTARMKTRARENFTLLDNLLRPKLG